MVPITLALGLPMAFAVAVLALAATPPVIVEKAVKKMPDIVPLRLLTMGMPGTQRLKPRATSRKQILISELLAPRLPHRCSLL